MSADIEKLQEIKAAMRRQWMAGDFGVIARSNAGAGEEFVHGLALSAGTHVLDIACGTGNVTVPLARLGCIVTGVDLAPNLLAQAKERMASEGLSATLDEGDAEELPYPDASFDVVVSMFGAMFAPRPQIVVQEMARVLRPGGLLAMANWTPGSFSGAMFRVGSRHVPPPPGVQPPVLWGDPSTVQDRLCSEFTQIDCRPTLMDFDLPMPPKAVVAHFRCYFGPTQLAFERLDPPAQARFAADLESLWAEANAAPEPEKHTVIHNEYLRVIAKRKPA